MGGVVYLNGLVVDPKERGKGIGTKLLFEFKAKVQQLRATMIFFFVPAANRSSVNFYDQNGFIKGKEYVFFSKNLEQRGS
ncbi:GNAT family N-acetyltransferase [Candidatus Woesearchaeota archaeon]|nr:GNAT family N-acetyltransferase [Candidatus Woesearchaeota archaeon]